MAPICIKRLWILNHHAATPDQGWGTRHYDIARTLADKGYDVTVFASSFFHVTEEYQFDESVVIQEREGFRFVWLRTGPAYHGNGVCRMLNMLSYVWQVLRVSKRFLAPDVVVGSSVHPFAWLAAELLARKHGAVYVAEIRDLWPQTLVDIGRIKPSNPVVRLFGFLEDRMFRTADGVIALLPNMGRYLEKLGKVSRGLWIVPNGTDPSVFDSNESLGVFDRYPILQQTLQNYITCTYAGSLVRSEGLYGILEAARHVENMGLNSVRFLIIGDGTEKEPLKAYAEDLGVGNVIFHDKISKNEIPAVLCRSTVLLISLLDRPIYEYGVSLNKLFDYLCAARPIVFAGNVALNPVEISGCGICVPPENPKRMAEGIQTLLEMSSEDQRSLGLKGRAYLESHHSMDIIAKKFIDACQEAAALKFRG